MGLDLSAVADHIPDVLVDAAKDLIVEAEDAMLGKGRGAEKRAFVREGLKKIARTIDMPGVPEPIETWLEDGAIDLIVSVVFKAIRKQLRAPSGALPGAVIP